MKRFVHALSLRDVLPSALSVVVLGIILCYLLTPSWSALGYLGWWSIPVGIAAGVGLYCLGFICTWLPFGFQKQIVELTRLLHRLFRDFTWFDIVVVSCLAGIGEELLIRGALQSWLVEQLNPLTGILIASLVFGLMHYLSAIYVALTALLGVCFGAGLYFSGSIVLVIIAHIVYDLLAFFIIVKRPHWLGVDLEYESEKLPINEYKHRHD